MKLSLVHHGVSGQNLKQDRGATFQIYHVVIVTQNLGLLKVHALLGVVVG